MGIYQHLYHNWHSLEKNALEIDTVELSYLELHKKVLRFAAWLDLKNIKKGDVVAVQLPKSIALLQVILGTMAYGATVLPLNENYTPQERLFYIKDAHKNFTKT